MARRDRSDGVSAGAAALLLAALVVGPCVGAPVVAAWRHDRLADALAAGVRAHAAGAGLVCGEPVRLVGSFVGAGGDECDVGARVTCRGPYAGGEPEVAPGVRAEVESAGPGVHVFTAVQDTLPVGWDVRCW